MITSLSNHRDLSVITLQSLKASSPKARLVLEHNSWPCIVGKNGLTTRKCEGDLSTPIGQWPLLHVFYRPDRIAKPITALPVFAITPQNGWCDDPTDRNYNKAVTLPYPANCEQLWRTDHVYDICVVLNYNIMPRKKGFGSAIFFHLTRPDHTPTEGCVAVDYFDMLQILKRIKPRSLITI